MIYEMKSYSHKEIHRDINANKLANAALKSDDFANRVFLVNKQSGEARANGRESEQAHVFSMSGIYIWSQYRQIGNVQLHERDEYGCYGMLTGWQDY